jgi:hypothetical protein
MCESGNVAAAASLSSMKFVPDGERGYVASRGNPSDQAMLEMGHASSPFHRTFCHAYTEVE